MKTSDWMIMPVGLTMICRYPYKGEKPADCRIATSAELVSVNPEPFPWGYRLDGADAMHPWKKHRLSVGGLVANDWFVTAEGVRLGGQPQVSFTEPNAAGRYFMYLHGGPSRFPGQLEANEGWAVIRQTNDADRRAYYEVQEYASKRVVGDGGRIVMSPVTEDGVIYVGFAGRCMVCPNLRRDSFPALQAALPKFLFRLWPEWEDWDVVAPQVSSLVFLG